jgi:hypothetical protein
VCNPYSTKGTLSLSLSADGRLTAQPGTPRIYRDTGLPRDSITLAPPHQIRGKAGDIIFAHYCMPHTVRRGHATCGLSPYLIMLIFLATCGVCCVQVAPNVSPNIRYAVYFRLSSVSHAPGTFRREALTDIWLDYAPLAPLLLQGAAAP